MASALSLRCQFSDSTHKRDIVVVQSLNEQSSIRKQGNPDGPRLKTDLDGLVVGIFEATGAAFLGSGKVVGGRGALARLQRRLQRQLGRSLQPPVAGSRPDGAEARMAADPREGWRRVVAAAVGQG